MKVICIVQNKKKELIEGAIVNLLTPNKGSYDLKYDSKSKTYVTDIDIPVGKMIIIDVTFEGYEQARFKQRIVKETIFLTLGELGTKYVRCGKEKLPHREYVDLIGVTSLSEEGKKVLENLNLQPISNYEGKRLTSGKFFQFKLEVLNDKSKKQKHILQKNTLKVLRKAKGIIEPGIVYDIENGGNMYTNVIIATPLVKSNIKEIRRLTLELNLKIAAYLGKEILIQAPDDCGYNLYDLIDQLYVSELFEAVYPEAIINVIDDAISPPGVLWYGQFDHDVINVKGAWESLQTSNPNLKYGRGDIIVGVKDTGIPQVSGVIPAFTGMVQAVVSGTQTNVPKLHKLYDFYNYVDNNDNDKVGDENKSDHGINVSGIISARVTETDPVISNGSLGVAPDTRLMATILYSTSSRIAEGIRWMAGLKKYKVDPSEPEVAKLDEGIDVYVTSQSLSSNSSAFDLNIKNVIKDLLIYGRKGRGLLMIASAGNESSNMNYISGGDNRFSTFENVLSIGSVSYFPDYVGLHKAIYSNSGKIDFCAPSSNGGGGLGSYDPPRKFKTWTPTRVGTGVMPDTITPANTFEVEHSLKAPFPLKESNTTAAVQLVFKRRIKPQTKATEAIIPGQTTIQVENTDHFVAGVFAIISNDIGVSELFKIDAVGTSSISVDTNTPLTKNYPLTSETKIHGGAFVPDTNLKINVNSGDSITVDSLDGFEIDMLVFIWDKTNSVYEFLKVSSVSGGILTFHTMLANSYLSSDDVEIHGLTTLSVADASLYEPNEKLALKYVKLGYFHQEEVTVLFRDLSADEIYVTGVSFRHELDNGSKIDICVNHYSEVSTSLIFIGPLPAGYNPVDTLMNDITSGEDSMIEVNNAGDFVNGTLIKIESGGNIEWKQITGISSPALFISSTDPFIHDHLVAETTVTAYPTLKANNPRLSLDVMDHIKIEHSSHDSIYAETLHYYSHSDYWALRPNLPENTAATNSWKKVIRVPGLRLDNIAGLVVDDKLLLGNPKFDSLNLNENSETVEVEEIVNGETVILNSLRKSHSNTSGLYLYKGTNNYIDNFGGTSSASPTVGGVIALMLSANPNLTWREIIYILKDTAEKIDLYTKGYSGTPDDTTGIIDSNGNSITLSPSDSDPTIRPLGQGRWKNKAGDFIFNMDGSPSGVTDTSPYSSDWYGYGMVNAKAAVDKALNYDESWLNLMIRDHLLDEGDVDNIGNIQSPDIWLQHTEVDYTVNNTKPNFSKAPPHENPKKDSDRYIYARVKNKGEQLNNLECTVRFYIALSDGNNALDINSPFLFPDDWSDVNPINDITLNSGSKKTYFLGEKKINSGEINPSDNDFFANDDSNFIVSVPWDSSFNPPLSTPLKTYLLVQVSPHDGNRNGLGAESNSNLSFREIAFANFEINNGGDTGSLQEEINVDEFGSQVVTDFTVNVGVDIGKFRTEKVVVELIREDSLGVHSKASFSHDGTNWELLDENNNTPTWANMTKPVLTGSSTPATGEQTEITFENASFYISKLYRKLFIKVIMNSSSSTSTIDIPIAEEIHEINIIEPALESKGLSFGAPPLFPKSYAFADMENLTQIQDHAFGPKSGNETNVFRVTSRFTATVDTSAYAIVKGKMMVQPGDVAGIVNLILKPFTQPIPGFTPIKYIIYRGLKESNFINTSNSTEVTPKDPSNSEWIAELYNIHESQNGSGATFLSKAIGYDPTITGSTTIDQEFFKLDPDFQLPMAIRGVRLGEFDINQPFGIDIILEEGEFTPDFDFVRSEFEAIDISEIGNAFLNKLEREKILNFIDPAAFYGLHVKKNGLVEYRDSSNNTVDKKEQEIYDDIVEKFYTKNTTYVDIRNELGNSYNFFEHYNDGSIDEFNIQVKTDPFDDFILKKYGTNGWPILILNSISLTTTNETHDFSFKLRADENPKPILYIEHGGLQDLTKAEGGRFVEGDNLLQTGNLETEELTFEQPNTNDPDIVFNKLNISWLLKLHYSRQIDSSVNWTSIPKAVKTESYLDNVFGPVNLDIIPWNTDNNIKWIGIQDKKYIDASVNDFGYVAERGVAVEDTAAPEGGRVILYASALDSFKTPDLFPPVNGLTGGTSKKASFFEEAMSFAGYRLFFDVIDDAGTPITSLKLEPKTVESAPAQAMMILGLSRPEFDILKALTGLSNDYPATAFLEKIGSGSNFIKYKVGMQGLDTNGEYANVFPSTDIEVYSTDGLLFFTKKFSENEPLPTVYIRNAEEHIGIGDRTPMIFPVVLKNVDIGISTLIINKDIVKWIPPGDIIKVKDNTGTFHQLTVSNSSLNGVGQTELVVTGNIASLKENDSLFLTEKSWEDHIIDLDRSGSSGVFIGTDEMKDIVNSYATAVDNVINDLNAHLNLEAIVNNYASQIFDRALLLVKNDTLDDRILYWTRVKMEVILKSHEFMLQSFSSRNELIKLFEERSRGYNPDFTSPPVGTTKLILITGFDPFQLFPLEDRSQQNPSGAAALKLHGETITDGTEIAYIQAVVFPVRYKDFDDSVVEQVVEPFIPSSASPKVDMIMSLSLNGSKYYFDLERFAGRYRGGFHDNSSFTNVRPKSIGSNDSSNEFYETSLPVNKIITGPFNLTNQKIFYDQSYLTHGGTSQNHPTAMGPNTNTDIGSMPTGLAKEGSGSNYLSNEVFYRIARSRNNLNIVLSTGHYHLANPHPGFIPFGISAFTIEQILDEVEDAVRRSLNAI